MQPMSCSKVCAGAFYHAQSAVLDYRRQVDLNTVEAVVIPLSRADLWPLGPGDALLAGGTWLFSEPQPHLRRLVDLTALDWPPITLSDNGIELAATCPLAEVSQLSTQLPVTRPQWPAAPLFHQCCTALLASFKIWNTATVGGNVCLSFPAGAMISLSSALDGELEIWRRDGADYRIAVADFVTGLATNVLAADDVLRAVFLPATALRARTAYRKLAPSPLGRSGIVVIGRRDAQADGAGFTLVDHRGHGAPAGLLVSVRCQTPTRCEPRTRPSRTTTGPTTRTAIPTGAGRWRCCSPSR